MTDKSNAYASAELASTLRGDEVSEPIRPYAGLVDDPDDLALLNYYDSILDEPVTETVIGREIIQNTATRTIDTAVRHGSVSQMKAGTGLTSNEREGSDLLSDAADELRHEGAIGLVFGSPGCGKTATTLDVAMTWKAKTGGAVIGNTSWDGFDEVVRSDAEMLEAMANIEGPVLAILDEIAQELSGFGSGNKAAEQFSDSLLFIRKKEAKHGPHAKRGSVLLVGHTRTKTAKSIRRVASFAIDKPSRSDPGRARLLESEGGKDSWMEGPTFKGSPTPRRTTPNTNPASSTSCSKTTATTAIVDRRPTTHGWKNTSRRRSGPSSGMSYKEVGKADKDDNDYLVPYSREWVGTKYREWRDDDRYTELVPKDE